MLKKVAAILLAILLLSAGWLGVTGLTLLVALVPLLWISHKAEDNKAGWWSVFGYATLCFVGWNLATIWWIGYATPVGPFAATFASAIQSIIAFMLFHTVSKKAPKALAYTVLVSVWITFEYNYTTSDFSWPWLLLGNGYSNDIWAIQWYEYTGIFGGSLWTWLANILIFEALTSPRELKLARSLRASLIVAIPLIVSTMIFLRYDADSGESIEVSVIQPNVDCYDKFSGDNITQEKNLLSLLNEVPQTSQLILMPETSIPRYYDETTINKAPYIKRLTNFMEESHPDATLISGANTTIMYRNGEKSETARKVNNSNRYYDVFNSALLINQEGVDALRHKSRLVIGVENTPTWIFTLFRFFVIDLGGIVGQIGRGTTGDPFPIGSIQGGAAICYEGLYGNFYGEFVRGGAEFMTIISNDGWWGDTPGYKHLYTLSAVRAVEHRRAIARSANTGMSGFIDSRGVSYDSLGWGKRGVLTNRVTLNSKMTIYTLYGDYIARVLSFIAAISLLYFAAYRARKRHYLVD